MDVFLEENIEMLLSQKFINQLKEKNFKTIEELEMSVERRKQIISKKEKGTKSLSEERQADGLIEFLEEEKENLTNKLQGLSFTTFGQSIILGYEKVIDLLKEIVTVSAGKFFYGSKKRDAEFVVYSYESSRRILTTKDHKLAKKKLVSVKFIAALVFGCCRKEDYHQYQFKINTPKEEDVCPCRKDPTIIGINEYPTILYAYWEEKKTSFS